MAVIALKGNKSSFDVPEKCYYRPRSSVLRLILINWFKLPPGIFNVFVNLLELISYVKKKIIIWPD